MRQSDELLGALDGSDQSGREFYNRLCEACCRLGAMERAGLLLYDAFYRWCRDASEETHNWPSTARPA